METLLALAIMSVASLALFQSTVTLLRLSDRTVNAALKSQDEAIIQKSFSQLVAGMVQAWPEDKKHVFRGDAEGFSGLTRTPFHTLTPGLNPFSLSVQNDADKSRLIYQSGDVEWVLQEFAFPNARISYLGADHAWRPVWPPKMTPKVDSFNSEEFFFPPSFPLAIKLSIGQDDGREAMVWIAATENRAELPVSGEF